MRSALVAVGVALVGGLLVSGPSPAQGAQAQLPVCGGPGWTYVEDVGVYVGFCVDPLTPAETSIVYDPSEPEGPCFHIQAVVSGRTDVCADTRTLVGDWAPCMWLVPDRGLYSSFCWDGRRNSGDPDARAFVNENGWPCVRVEQFGLEAHVDVCVSAVDVRRLPSPPE